jgi:hypothetical protein
MTLILRKPLIREPGLAEAEWNLTAALKTVPEWQWLTMLNYEYARCCRPVIKAVNLLRKAKRNPKCDDKTLPRFARYLAKNFPDFPKTPWVQIAETKRVERLEWIGVTSETGFYFTDPAWQIWKFFDGEVETLREELTNAEAKSYGVFKIDFSQEDKIIAEQFRTWMEQRRSELTLRPNKKTGCTAGRGHKKRKCEDYLRTLGGLRALKYWGNAEKAETMIEGLYTDAHSWKRAEGQAGEMFTRLAVAWKYCATPFDPFDSFDPHRIFPPHSLRNPLPAGDSSPKKRLAEIKNVLAADFVVSSLKTDSI